MVADNAPFFFRVRPVGVPAKTQIKCQLLVDSPVVLHEELFEKLYDKLPKEFQPMRQLLMSALWRRPEGEGLAPEVCC